MTDPYCTRCHVRLVWDYDHFYCLHCGRETPPEVDPHPPDGMASWPTEMNPRHERHTHPEEVEE